ncbi:MAG: 3-hydroxyacyl-CoA dehydrogenase [Hyphomicrobiales bacterium]|nr:3-hydroxyacyl-CoA dehydrogenase [Hyphomicrobiales bacterium]
MNDRVRIETQSAIAFVIIDNPPVNAGSWETRSGLLAAIEQCEHDPNVAAIVVIGAARMFMAGADINEFDVPIRDPQMPAVIAAIEDCAKPVVAAISGAALGAGYELALACDARIATEDAVVGLPEVLLGVIPGAGGTQRLPRLIGVSRAIDLIGHGRRVVAREALRDGMIDALATEDLRKKAAQLATSLKGEKHRLRDALVPPETEAVIEDAAAKTLAQAKGDRAVVAAIASVRKAATLPFAQALVEERAAFHELRQTREAAAKRYLFFAEREAARVADIRGAKARTVGRVGVVGAGTMGVGIALCFLDAGLTVSLVERDAASLEAGLERLSAAYRRMVDSGRISDEVMASRLAHVAPSIDMHTLADADLIIEAVFEDMDIKRSLLRELDGIARPGAVIASNTSYLDLDALARETSRPSDIVGLHFFAPAQIMGLLEIVRGAYTAPDVLATALSVAKEIGKTPIVARVGEGFIGNRLYSAYRQQCEFMLEEGAFPEQIDAALVAFGFAMGPFAVADLSGLDIAWRTRQRLAATRDPKARYSDVLDRLCEAGRLGQKSGKGWYAYPDGARRGVPDDETRAVIEDASRRKGVTRRTINDAEIIHRAICAIANEAALLLAEGISQRPSDVDLAMVRGYGFPTREGGPLFWAARLEPQELRRWLAVIAACVGHGFRLGDVAATVEPLAPAATPPQST